MASLGWTPGTALGDSSSSYHAAGHITAASHTGVKVVLKDDTLGIGAKRGAQDGECTGLLGLEGLLGRLNGDQAKVDRIKMEEDRRKNEWVGGRYGVRFVKGEIWKGEDFSRLRETGAKVKGEIGKDGKLHAVVEKFEELEVKKEDSSEDDKKSKKRKRSEEKEEKKSKKDKKRKSSSPSDSATTPEELEPSKKRSKSDKKLSKEERKALKKAEKKAAKKTKKEEKKRKKKEASSDSDSSDSESEQEKEETKTPVQVPARILTGRAALRAKFITAKRSAVMNQEQLNEVGSIYLSYLFHANFLLDSYGKGIT